MRNTLRILAERFLLYRKAISCKVKKELIQMIHENADKGEQAADLLMVAKYMERIGDHATNISEWVIFSITGEHKSMN